ncbi:MAG: zinc-dependent peptidase [Burkholderiales bacterium]|nr:zinc-dependent peptidase [Burkholderiales bacterium]MDE1927891.1 zinc-dependent peptidase [Burkholderiales bacterium]MDE2158641.1 zinc-dependent peptidase [Burkholderiales bacterium]MDE2501926.1 zinc-dependent peptidase [Burkholderiales bacterium]
MFVALALSVAAWLAGPAALAVWRRARIVRRPFPQAWREILRRRLPAYARLPADLQWRLKKRIQVLLAEKPFIGCAGLEVSEEMRVLVAAQAALLLLHDHAGYFPALRQILLYPGAFVVERSHSDGSGLTHETRRALVGESWQQGQVLLAWDEVVAGAADPADGRNVVVHEFAHQLDQERGRANGAPWLGRRDGYARWAAVLGAEYAALRQRVTRGEDGLIAPYGATDAAEFFAVVSEHFFEQGAELARLHPDLYREFARYYGVDPAQW